MEQSTAFLASCGHGVMLKSTCSLSYTCSRGYVAEMHLILPNELLYGSLMRPATADILKNEYDQVTLVQITSEQHLFIRLSSHFNSQGLQNYSLPS